jgi:hypothetical protein
MVKIVKAQKPLLIKKIFQNKIAATYKVQKRMLKNLIKPNQIKIHKIYLKINKINSKTISRKKKCNGLIKFLITIILNKNSEAK